MNLGSRFKYTDSDKPEASTSSRFKGSHKDNPYVYIGDTTMRAVRFYPPGGTEALKYTTAEPSPPALAPGTCRIKVHAVSVIYPEVTWPIYQDQSGKWTSHIPGHDFAGVIEEIKSSSDKTCELKVGDAVMAFTSRRNHEGGMAEYAVADLDQVVRKPGNLSMNEAASVPLSSLTAWQALFDNGKLTKGQRVLVLGAAGGTGIWAVQFAKMAGAYVFGTGSEEKSREMFEGFGGDRFVNYRKEDLKSVVGDQGVDLVLDCVGEDAAIGALGVLKEGGLLISIVAYNIEQAAKEHQHKALFFIVSMNEEELTKIAGLLEKGEVRTIVDSVFPLEKAQDAFEYARKGHVKGKVVLKVADT